MILAHTADWHLSTSGIQHHQNGLNARLMDRYSCARFVVEDSIGRGAQIILHGGDLFNGWRPTPTEVRLAKRALEPAVNAGVPVLLLKGNHDDVRTPTEEHALDLMREMAGVVVVDRPCLLNVWRKYEGGFLVEALDLSPADGAGLEMQLACLPWPRTNLLLRDEEARKLEPGERNLLIREKCMDCLRGLAAQRIEGVPAVLLGHFSLDVATVGDRLMMLGGDWTLSLQEIAALRFDAVMLGHIHKPQAFSPNDIPVAYCGSPEATAFGEEGEEKQYLVWAIGDDGITATHVPTPYRRLVTITPEEAASLDHDLLRSRLADTIVRLEIPPDSTLTVDEARRAIEAAGAFDARVTKARSETVRRRESQVSAGMGPAEALREWLAQKPDLHPFTDALLVEALRVEEALGGGS